MKVGKPGNLQYITAITEDIFKQYDDRLITRKQAIEILTSWDVVINAAEDWTGKTYFDRASVKFKLHSDVFGEYDGNDPIEKWKHISEGIEENYVSPDVVKNNDVVTIPQYANILEKVEEKAKLEFGNEAAKNKARSELERAIAAEDARIKEEKRLCKEFNAKEAK